MNQKNYSQSLIMPEDIKLLLNRYMLALIYIAHLNKTESIEYAKQIAQSALDGEPTSADDYNS